MKPQHPVRQQFMMIFRHIRLRNAPEKCRHYDDTAPLVRFTLASARQAVAAIEIRPY
jgi:hypothetical protein